MTKRKTISHEALGRRLDNIDGFRKGVEDRKKIIKLGHLFRMLRKNELEMNQSMAARLIGIKQSELSRIENGYGERGPSYATITHILEAYTRHMESKGAEIKLSIEISSHGHRESFSLIDAGDELLANES